MERFFEKKWFSARGEKNEVFLPPSFLKFEEITFVISLGRKSYIRNLGKIFFKPEFRFNIGLAPSVETKFEFKKYFPRGAK